jgi:hypothetical protein
MGDDIHLNPALKTYRFWNPQNMDGSLSSINRVFFVVPITPYIFFFLFSLLGCLLVLFLCPSLSYFPIRQLWRAFPFEFIVCSCLVFYALALFFSCLSCFLLSFSFSNDCNHSVTVLIIYPVRVLVVARIVSRAMLCDRSLFFSFFPFSYPFLLLPRFSPVSSCVDVIASALSEVLSLFVFFLFC